MRRTRLDLNEFADWSLLCVRVTRMVLALVCTVLVTMPLTQHLWTWDRFLHGGQDVETGILLILTSLCLIPVLIRACKAAHQMLLAGWKSVRRLLPAMAGALGTLGLQVFSHLEFMAGAPPGAVTVPLQI